MIQRETLSLTPSGGSASGNTKDLRGRLGRLVATPTTATTTYDLKITDELSVAIYHVTGIMGTHRENPDFPIKGIHTVQLLNASADEAFTVAFYVEESP